LTSFLYNLSPTPLLSERGFTGYKSLFPFSDRRRGQGKRLQQLKEKCLLPFNGKIKP
jgi:hypothetical protein